MTAILRRIAPYTLLLSPLTLAAQNPVYGATDNKVTARVNIMAISTSIHQAFAGNQDTYLADVALKDGHQTARLIDLYSGFGTPIRRSLLTDRRQFVMHLTRKHSCDIPAAKFFLDPADSSIFDAASRAALTPGDAMIPCYMVDHDQTRLAKK